MKQNITSKILLVKSYYQMQILNEQNKERIYDIKMSLEVTYAN
jgi:hypothetical protein